MMFVTPLFTWEYRRQLEVALCSTFVILADLFLYTFLTGILWMHNFKYFFGYCLLYKLLTELMQ